MNLTITPRFTNNQNRGQSVGFGATPKSRLARPDVAVGTVQDLVGNFAKSVANESRTGKEQEIVVLQQLKSLLDTVLNGDLLKFCPVAARAKVMSKTVAAQIATLERSDGVRVVPKVTAAKIPPRSKRAPKKSMSISDIAQEQLDKAARNGLFRNR